ncbi:MAG: hypothetical protein KAJ98_00835 [Spirochaetaceae bacterium]|nr:hypothetical protein [Spirochaetaceae bacterium]
MPQAENGHEKENEEALRRFIDRLENWPEDEPPSPSELRALRREIRLTESDRDKLELLAENHIRRARTALDANSYSLAAAELARASQLRPMDSRPRIELAGVYLQRSLESGYGRNDRQRAIKLAKKALELNPGDVDARQFLQEYRRMNADFLAVRYRRYIIPVLVLTGLLGAMIWWQGDWIVNLFNPASGVTGGSPLAIIGEATPESRNVEVNAAGLTGGNLETEIILATVGRRNDASFMSIRGRLRSSTGYLGELKLLIRGRDAAGNTLFAVPWTVRDKTAPILIPGDSEVLSLFRWLAGSEEDIDRLELVPFEIEMPRDIPQWNPSEPELVWDTARPDGASLSAEIRDFETIEAYDRQVLLMNLAITNTGVGELSYLLLGISLGSDFPDYTHSAVSSEEPALIRGERRVWSLAMGFPLDADLSERPVTVRIKEIGR